MYLFIILLYGWYIVTIECVLHHLVLVSFKVSFEITFVAEFSLTDGTNILWFLVCCNVPLYVCFRFLLVTDRTFCGSRSWTMSNSLVLNETSLVVIGL